MYTQQPVALCAVNTVRAGAGDALKWCGASEAQDIRKRLRGVAARLSASLKELGLDDL